MITPRSGITEEWNHRRRELTSARSAGDRIAPRRSVGEIVGRTAVIFTVAGRVVAD